jgi:hypothetical protein
VFIYTAPCFFRAFTFYSLLSCYFRCTLSARAWFVLSLMHAHKLLLFLQSLRWSLQKMLPKSLRSEKRLHMNSRKDLWLVNKRSSQRRLIQSKMLGLIDRINLKAPVTARLLLTMAVMWRFVLRLLLLAWVIISHSRPLRMSILRLCRFPLITFLKVMPSRLVQSLSRYLIKMKQWYSKTYLLLVSVCHHTRFFWTFYASFRCRCINRHWMVPFILASLSGLLLVTEVILLQTFSLEIHLDGSETTFVAQFGCISFWWDLTPWVPRLPVSVERNRGACRESAHSA